MAILHIFPSLAAAASFNRSTLERDGIVCGTPALTFKSLSEMIAEAAGDHRRQLSPIGSKLLLAEVIERRYTDGTGYFAPLSAFPGFVSSLDSMIGELKQALLSAETFAVRAGSLCRRTLGELADIYSLYSRTLFDKGLMDSHDPELSALAFLLGDGTLPDNLGLITGVIVHDIYDMSAVQLALLAAISRRYPVELRLPYNPELEHVYSYVARTADMVEGLDNSDMNLNPVFDELHGAFATPLLAAVHGLEGTPPPAAIALIEAPGAYRECEEIGRRIRNMIESGVDPADIAVLFRTMNRFEPMFEDVCRRFSIPVSYRRGAPLATAPLVRAALSPCAVVESRFAREELLALCASSYLEVLPQNLSAGEIAEILASSGYINETLGTAEEKIDRLISRQRAKGKETSLEVRVRNLLGSLLADLRAFKGKSSISRLTDLLENFIRKYRIYHRGISGEKQVLKRDASSITLLRQLLVDLRRDCASLGLADKVMTTGEFMRLLHQGMEGTSLSGERSSGVAVMNFHDARGLTFPHVFIGGLNEAVCPQRHDSHPLLKDSDKLLLRRGSPGTLLRTAKEKGEEELLLFWLAIASAEESLVFSCSYADSRGNEMLRSPFLDDLLAKVEVNVERSPTNLITPEPQECREKEELLNSLALRHHFTLPAGSDAFFGDSLRRIFENGRVEAERELFFTSEEVSERSILANPHSGKLAAPEVEAELAAYYESAEGERFSPTSLEEYGVCPFRYFLRRLLRIAAPEKADIELESRDVGSLAHLILKDFFQRMQREGRLPLQNATAALPILREEAARIFGEWEARRHTGEALLWELEKETLLPLLERLVEREASEPSGFTPHSFELEIDPPLQVSDEAGDPILLTGKVDRVDLDLHRGRLRVVDYKLTGNAAKYKQLLKKENMGEISFQMPVYLLAAAESLAGESCVAPEEFTACYWLLSSADLLEKEFGSTKKEDFTGFFATDPGERATLGENNFLNRLAAKVRRMKQGDFQITPRGCGLCDFSGVCRYVDVNLREL